MISRVSDGIGAIRTKSSIFALSVAVLYTSTVLKENVENDGFINIFLETCTGEGNAGARELREGRELPRQVTDGEGEEYRKDC